MKIKCFSYLMDLKDFHQNTYFFLQKSSINAIFYDEWLNLHLFKPIIFMTYRIKDNLKHQYIKYLQHIIAFHKSFYIHSE